MPVSAVWAGDQETGHLKAVSGVGDAHVTCSTTGDTPFRLNLAVQDVGHTLIIGPTGAGKSTFLALLAMQWLRYPGAKVVIFDKDRSARAATMAAGGTYYEPGDETSPGGLPAARATSTSRPNASGRRSSSSTCSPRSATPRRPS